jgi:hypothetical protein
MAYQKLQPERAYVIPGGTNFDISKDNPSLYIKQRLVSGTDFDFTVATGKISSITMRVTSLQLYYTSTPSLTIGNITGTGTGGTCTASFDANGALVITSGGTGSGYTSADSLSITLSAYSIIPSARMQPFIIYTSSCTSLGSSYSAAGDSMGTVPCTSNTILPIQFSSVTPAANSAIALW